MVSSVVHPVPVYFGYSFAYPSRSRVTPVERAGHLADTLEYSWGRPAFQIARGGKVLEKGRPYADIRGHNLPTEVSGNLLDLIA